MAAASISDSQGPGAPRGPGPILRYWKGQGPLWKVYWLWGVLGSLVLTGIYWIALSRGIRWLEQALLPVGLLYTAWILVAVWRCAFNTAHETYGHLARWLTVAWALNVILLVAFLELGLLATPFR